jgi:hypothetical protein
MIADTVIGIEMGVTTGDHAARRAARPRTVASLSVAPVHATVAVTDVALGRAPDPDPGQTDDEIAHHHPDAAIAAVLAALMALIDIFLEEVLPPRPVRARAEDGNATTAGDEVIARVTMIAGTAIEVAEAGSRTPIATSQVETPRTMTGTEIATRIEIGIGTVIETEMPAVAVTGGSGTAVDNEAVVAGGVAVAAVAVERGID